jgi:transcriptional regulator with XRE-family HTH domain
VRLTKGAGKSEAALSAVLGRHLDDIATALNAIIDGEDEARQLEQIDDALGQAIDVARTALPDQAEDEPLKRASVGEVIGSRVKTLRTRAGWTQERLALAMEEAGFDWKRVTCTQVEVNLRRVSYDELLILAALFGVPAVEFLIPGENLNLEVAGSTLIRSQVRELLIGRGGSTGDGGAEWNVALSALGFPRRSIQRPADKPQSR